jgi:hypothetical protein
VTVFSELLPLTFHALSEAVNDAVLGAVPLARLGSTATAAPSNAANGR